MKFRKNIVRYSLILVGIALIIVVTLLGTMEITSKPTFCNTCHYMEPYVEAWKVSSHADVTCTDCHFPPGFKSKIEGKFTAISMVANYMTGIYKKSKPWAEISDASCLRSGCHQERLLSGKVMFKDKVIFDHEPHLTKLRRGKKLRCTSCHSQIVQGTHISVTESTCFLCHFKDQSENSTLNNCVRCHDAPVPEEGKKVLYDHTMIVKNDMDCLKCHGKMQVGDGAVPIERCHSCHANVLVTRKYDDSKFIHKNHVTDHKVECQNCHLMIQHKSISKSNEIIPECSSCHENTHNSQLDLFTGTGGRNVPDNPNPMYENGLNCQACHIFHSTTGEDTEFGDVTKATYESCDICHGPGYNRILNQWKNVMVEKIVLLEELYTDSKQNSFKISSSDPKFSDYEILLKDAQYNIHLVKTGNIVHNVAYSDELLQESFNNLAILNHEIAPDYKLPNFSKYGNEKIPSECNNCHYGIENVSKEIYGLNFSHQKHILNNGQSCYECHTNQNRHGEMKLSLQECLGCHHTQEKYECVHCHELQSKVYEGTVFKDMEDSADYMFEGEVSCRECHQNDDGYISRDTAENCINCHDDEYADILIDWQTETQELIESVDEVISGISQVDNETRLIIQEFQTIRDDGSLGAHNSELIRSRLQIILDKLKSM